MSNPLNLHPVDWFNSYGNFLDIFKGVKNYNAITLNEIALFDPTNPGPNDLNHTTFRLNASLLIDCLKPNAYAIPNGATVSKFMLLCVVRFRNDQSAAISYITHELMGIDIPYIRVRCDYFKVIKKQDRYGSVQTELIPWKKDEIKQDHSKQLMAVVPKFDDFIIEPDNKRYKAIIKNCYNHYSKFPHTPHPEPVTEADIPVTWNFINHIFNDGTPDKPQLSLALLYFKVLYEFPKKQLPILCLVSRNRNTGKTTFNNWLGMIFGNNYTSIAPEALTHNFNSSYATKNIITFEEAFVEKQSGIEKLKRLSTGKMIDVSQKFISEYSIPFYGKFVLCSNKVLDFMRIDDEEVRFWIRPIPTIKGKRNTKIEDQLYAEIPKFLRYLLQLPDVNFDNEFRTVLDEGLMANEALDAIKQESRSQMYKELELEIEDFFNQNPEINSFMASAKDIKNAWFKSNNQITAVYIRKVLKDEAGLIMKTGPDGRSIKYSFAFGDKSIPALRLSGMPFEFLRQEPSVSEEPTF